MTDLEDNINLGKNVFDDNSQESKILGLFGTNLFQIADCVSVPTFCYFVDHIWIVLENSPLKKLVTNQLFGPELCAARQDTFYPQQGYEQVNFYRKIESLFHCLVLPKLENRSLFTIG